MENNELVARSSGMHNAAGWKQHIHAVMLSANVIFNVVSNKPEWSCGSVDSELGLF